MEFPFAFFPHMNRRCPHCSTHTIIKAGQFFRKVDSRFIQRFKCKSCGKNFSTATGKDNFRHRKRREVPMIRALYSSGISMRRMAKVLRLHRTTIKRKVLYLSLQAQKNLTKFHHSLHANPVEKVQFDDLISLEHTKLKPLSVSIAIDKSTRKFLAFSISKIPAFGHLADKSVKKYGHRKSEHKLGLKHLFQQLQPIVLAEALFESDEHNFYPEMLSRYFPQALHKRYKGGRSCIAGQGELKKLKYDPLFTLNHNFAMLRANINRLFRKTWCTTKLPEMLMHHLYIYMDYHNQELV